VVMIARYITMAAARYSGRLGGLCRNADRYVVMERQG
jgi:hypothetical protein